VYRPPHRGAGHVPLARRGRAAAHSAVSDNPREIWPDPPSWMLTQLCPLARASAVTGFSAYFHAVSAMAGRIGKES